VVLFVGGGGVAVAALEARSGAVPVQHDGA